MPTQDTYRMSIPVGQNGRRANMEEWNAITRIAGGTIRFGVPVKRSAEDTVVEVAAAADTGFVGLTEANVVLGNVGADADRYVAGQNVAVDTMAVLNVIAGAAVVQGAPVYWNPATGRYTANAAHFPVPGATYDSSAAADGDIVKVRLRPDLG